MLKKTKTKKSCKGGKHMAVSMAIIPTLEGKAATSIMKTLETSRIKPYSPESKLEAEQRIQEILKKRENK